jgi:hypothetical protein
MWYIGLSVTINQKFFGQVARTLLQQKVRLSALSFTSLFSRLEIAVQSPVPASAFVFDNLGSRHHPIKSTLKVDF